MLSGSTGNPGRAPLAERLNDLYETPPEAVEALLKVEPLPQRIWEPACGRGAIVKVLEKYGHEVYATDLVDYGADYLHGIDFLRFGQRGCECIVTNPPFKLADQFVRHAIKLCPKVVMLLRLAFLEGAKRSDIIDTHLSRVWLFRNRLPRMHREGWDGPKSTSTIAFGWFVFERGWTGPTELCRITWERS